MGGSLIKALYAVLLDRHHASIFAVCSSAYVKLIWYKINAK